MEKATFFTEEKNKKPRNFNSLTVFSKEALRGLTHF